MSSEKFNVIILAAGKSVRMGSHLPKVLHPVAGQPMLARILTAVSGLSCEQIRVVVGSEAHLITPIAGKFKALCFKQPEDVAGTAKAVEAAKPEELKGHVLIVNGDHPLIIAKDLQNFLKKYLELNCDLAIGTFSFDKPNEYGRVILDDKHDVSEIVESADLEKKKLNSQFVNTGIYAMKTSLLA